jgi:ribosomal protein S3AE
MLAIQKKVDNWKLKRWFSVYAAKPFNDVLIGEIPAKDEKNALGRQIKVGLNVLTNNPQNSYMNLFFKITDVQGDKAQTTLVKMELLFSYIRTLVRKYRSVSLAVVKGKSNDNLAIIIKPIVVTAHRETHTRIRGIRKEMSEMLASYIRENDSETIVKSIIEGKLQHDLFAKLRHIAPLGKIEIKRLDISR